MTELRKEEKGLATLAIHGGYTASKHLGATNVPIYQTAAYQFENSEHSAALFNMEQEGNIYSRISNPTTDLLEQRLAALEGGVGALVTASGQSAALLSILNIAETGDEIIASKNLYGGTITLFTYTLQRLGITIHFVDQNDLDQWQKHVNERTKAFYIESISNPSLDVPDIEELANLAHQNGVPLIVDNTFATPVLLRPFEFGADLVIHSTTKYIGGHGNTIGGVVVDSGKFPWDNGKFKRLSDPDPAYHGLSYIEHVGEQAYITKLKAQLNRDIGATMAPFNAFLLIQGLETLSLRMERHSTNALAVANFLSQHPQVEWVNYPGLENHSTYTLAKKYLDHGQGGILTFGVKGGYEAAKRFIDKVQLFTHAANVGDVRSLVIHPSSSTHHQLTNEQKIAAGVSDDLVRVSVGIEDINDLLADLEQALAE
ncbi:O-acetylhomoserine aminocarboxypropyltransferase/cysteine synthase family protein [Tepidibacillus decaturensis]|uniref:O-succinylhomoserine sulfhydrylase n=1 Tax=Tepidibacillus decaturensis TaxID=1413211 RepID=A0A135L2E7_9BACI|nr:O-acetylhomoserine aminocarboxypropyltransferase/cysteine synthase family protein [Tepidibacillus decaturensis]KXG43155.1 O-acetylhomoserine aminocarboxypropyltransferase [Tepidibacillus decaturensis]